MKSIINLFAAPVELFEEQKAEAGWVIPLILVSVLGALTALLMQPAQAAIMAAQFGDSLPQEQLDIILEKASAFSIMPFIMVPISTLIRWALVGGVLLLVSMLFAGNLSYKKAFSIIGWSSVILAIEGLVNMGLVHIGGIESVSTMGDLARTGLNIFFSEGATGTGLYLLLSSITPFAVWYVILAGIGVQTIGEVSRNKAYAISGITWALGTGFTVTMGALGKSFGIG